MEEVVSQVWNVCFGTKVQEYKRIIGGKGMGW